MSILETRNLTRKFGGLTAVKNISLQIKEGDFIGLVGPNGAGKTTLFNLISGFLRPTAGRIFYRNRDITRWSPHRRVQSGITRTFQQSRVFPGVTVEQNIRMASFQIKKGGLREIFFGPSPQEKRLIKDQVTRVLQLTDLSDYRDYLAYQLSYGYQRRLEIAIALATNPQVLLLDEPFGGTHQEGIASLAGILRGLNEDGITIVFIEHRMEAVANFCDQLIYMNHGNKVIPIE